MNLARTVERHYQKFFRALPIRQVSADEDLHLLNPEELRLVRATEYWAYAGAVLVELLAYLCIFLPVYEYPHIFEGYSVRLGGPFVSVTEPIAWLRDLWMLLVTVLELYVLLLLNLAAVHGVAVATGYVRREKQAGCVEGLIRIALESRFGVLNQFGIDPYEKMNRWMLYLFLAFNRLKGLLGSVIARAVITNLFGREIMRVYLDFSGMPIYMLINIYTTRVILRNARVVVMGQTSIETVLQSLPKLTLTPWEKGLIYDSLQFIAVNKRDYHANHYYLSKALLNYFDIPTEASHPLPADYLDKLPTAREPVAAVCRVVIILGFLLDGAVSWRERKQLSILQQKGILDVSHAELEHYRRSFVDGQGLLEMTQRLLPAVENSTNPLNNTLI